ncbi:MAG TPA: alkaline phosphatase family protein [Actinomycetota bacterium]|nr:alkaline phosphatase family protein [Actinomycetota bacterium]
MRFLRPAAAVVALLLIAGTGAALYLQDRGGVPSFRAQACALPREWLVRTQRGYHEPRSGQIAILPVTPAYMASGGQGWSHSGPWPYLQDVPLVAYGPKIIRPAVIDRPVTLADLAPTTAALMGFGGLRGVEGRVLREVAGSGERPALILTIIWDGGGWNTLDQWPDAWPNLRRMMERGALYRRATVGSSPSVTPAVHSTIGTGLFPKDHAITGVPVRDEAGVVVDAFLEGESSRFLIAPTVGELWDEANENRARIGLLGYEPWHLGMIGKGAEKPGGDRDHAVWVDHETSEWKTNPAHYELPPSVAAADGLEEDVRRLDAADGEIDRAWGDLEILDIPDRLEETPAFVHYHGRALRRMIAREGYGADRVTDLLYTNFKQIDRVGHYFNMASDQVRQNLVASDRELGRTLAFLDEEVGRGNYVVFLTADHGQQPDQDAIDGYGINPRELEADIDREFGPITRAAWPTEVFLLEDEMEARGVQIADVARFLGGYRLIENTGDPAVKVAGKGVFDPTDRLFDLAIPASLLPRITCSGGDPSARR